MIKPIKMGVITAALIMATALGLAACSGGEPEEHTFELRVQEQSLTQEDSVLRVKIGDMVTLVVSADEHISFHLHGYDIEKEASPEEPAILDFIANATGSFPFTIHVVKEIHEDADSHVEGEEEDHTEEDEEPEEEVELGRLEVQPR